MAGEDWVETLIRCPSCSEVLSPSKRVRSFEYCPCCGKHATNHPIPGYCPRCGVQLKNDPILIELINNEEESHFDEDDED